MGGFTRDPFAALCQRLVDGQVRFVVIGVWGANYYARQAGHIFTTLDQDLFLPPDPANLMRAWRVCEDAELTLMVGQEPLDVPRDVVLAERITELRAVVSAKGLAMQVDLALTMAGFTFDQVASRQRVFCVDGVNIPVARLADIVESKRQAARPKDQLFLATHEDILRQMFASDEEI